MSGKEHMIVGTTATVTMGVGFFLNDSIEKATLLIPLIIGGFIGSYMPDIDSHKSKASQVINKIIMILIVVLTLSYFLGLAFSLKDIKTWLNANRNDLSGVLLFGITTILGKLSPHRMFTHKWFGTIVFCYSTFLMGNKYFALGFTMGYILHIVCDRFTKQGKNLRFFEFKLPCKNAKNKTVFSW
ncbi:MAG: metal-dependent hydrolase [Clostridium sp.]|nr:metal-dependent hydrolase [Clostridium sp.]